MTRTQLILRILLPLHLTGLILMAGTTIIDYFAFLTINETKSSDLISLTSKFGSLVRTGAIILITTGITMFILSKNLWQQPLFRLKLALAITLVLHGMLVGNRQATRFRTLITQQNTQDLQSLTSTLNRFYVIQLTLFFIIIFVSVSLPRNYPHRP
ncbi:hypothetical protein ACQ86N_30130 [Puia sp. P3]|uniref:hypothetical protein n=1 Tax=Puia sp. P3 TaxID=3423952 RepID=UPI003D666D0E